MKPMQGAFHGEAIRLRPFTRALLADFESTARARHLTLDALVFLEELNGDAELLRQLLADLLGQALRRAPAGTNVTLVVSPREGQAEFRIADEGPGMTAEARERASALGATHGGRLSVTETEDGTLVCLVFPCDVGDTVAAIQLTVDGRGRRAATEGKPAAGGAESGVYARAGLAPTPCSAVVSRPARTSGRDT